MPPGCILLAAAPMRAVAPGASSRPAAGPASLAKPARAEPSWGRVLVTTVRQWLWWRLQLAGFGSARAGARTRGRFRRRRGRLGVLSGRRSRLAAIGTVLALGAVAALLVTGSISPAARVLPTGNPPAASAATSAAVLRSRAAAWIASQVGGMAILACDPVMCAALQAQGVIAGRLMPLRAGAVDPQPALAGADVLVTAAPVSRQFADAHAPALIASFSAAGTRIDVRAIEPGGAATYESALRADLAARRSAGSQLLRNGHITFTAPDARQLRAGVVDSRLLATLAALAAQDTFGVAAFGDASPGAQMPLRGATIVIRGHQDAAADLAAALALVRQQPPPYLPAHAAIVPLAAGHTALSIEFAAPSPLGLLTAVLAVAPQPAPSRTPASAPAVPFR